MNNKEFIHTFFKERVGILATMHSKEQVMLPLIEEGLGIKVKVPENLNTDRFGTFTRDIPRLGNQLEAAKHKAEYAMRVTGETLAFASEGSFGPHPLYSFLPFNQEIVLLIDTENQIEIIGEAGTTDTNYSHKVIKNFQEALEFGESVGFPEHALVVKLGEDTNNPNVISKGIITKEQLEESIHVMLKKSHNGQVFIETDMRAMFNSTRMRNIELATKDLINNIYNLCPSCSNPGFKLTNRKKGLPCSWCGLPTELTMAEIYFCKKCEATEEKKFPKGITKADPAHCQFCNP